MVLITEELVRKRSEHNECMISTLEELSLHQEDIEKIEHLQNWCRDVKILLLQSNLIAKIENLHKMKNLEYLNLALNNIELIENLEGCESLQKLDLTLNFIGELVSVESLQSNRNLEHLYLTGNPCADYEGYREFVIATLPRLKTLDSVEIDRSERIRALQNRSMILPTIVAEQIAYRKKRDQQKKQAILKLNDDFEENYKPTEEEEERYWKETSENTPETRIELAKHSRRSKQRGNQEKKETQKREIKLFNKEGQPNNINEAKIPFSFTEDDKTNSFVLTLEIYKYLDTSHLEVDVQPCYVNVKIKGKIFQVSLTEEIYVDKSKAQRSQTTGFLVITMPKIKGEPKIKKPESSTISSSNSTKFASTVSKRQFLEIGREETDMDFSKIIERNQQKSALIERRTSVKEKLPTEGFKDDPDVPPLV